MISGAIVTLDLGRGFTRELFIPFATGIRRVSMPESQPEGWAPLVVLCRTRRQAETPPTTPEPPTTLEVGRVVVTGVASERRPPPLVLEFEDLPPVRSSTREPDAPISLEERRRR